MLTVGQVFFVGITGGSWNHTRPVQTAEIQALESHLNMVAHGMNPFEVCRAPPSRGGPETADVVGQLFEGSKKDVNF